jgi:hypothetical protein
MMPAVYRRATYLQRGVFLVFGSKITCLGCGQKVDAIKAMHPQRGVWKQCPRCLTFAGEQSPWPPHLGGPQTHTLTYRVMGGGGAVDKQFQRELPHLQRAGWMVWQQSYGGQVQSFFSKEPAMLTVTLIRQGMGMPAPMPPPMPQR